MDVLTYLYLTDGYDQLSAIIDIFTKIADVIPLKTRKKNGKDIVEVFT
jgi:hypothetical protein